MVGQKAGLRKRIMRDEADDLRQPWDSLAARQACDPSVDLTPLPLASHECADLRVNTMQLETKFLRLRTPVTLGSRFGDWHVTWLGGWSRYRLYYLVMVVRLQPLRARPRRATTGR
jgi:hypothetical protein